MVLHQCSPKSCWFVNWSLYTESKEKLQKEAVHSGLGAGSFNKQGNLLGRLVSMPACQNLKSLYRGFNCVLSHLPSRWSQRLTLSRLSPWNIYTVGKVGRALSQNRGESEEPQITQVQLSEQLVVTSWRLPPPTALRHYFLIYAKWFSFSYFYYRFFCSWWQEKWAYNFSSFYILILF